MISRHVDWAHVGMADIAPLLVAVPHEFRDGIMGASASAFHVLTKALNYMVPLTPGSTEEGAAGTRVAWVERELELAVNSFLSEIRY